MKFRQRPPKARGVSKDRTARKHWLGTPLVEWQIARELIQYADALAKMEERVAAIRSKSAKELIWYLEHPPLYTAGTSAIAEELLNREVFPVFRAGRGGRYTYHGPGQLVGYVMLDLSRRRKDVRWYIRELENWIIAVLDELGVCAGRRDDRIGVWTMNRSGQDAKIAAIGVRIRHWITYHGFALNISPNLDHFRGIVPCGLSEYPVTSLQALGFDTSRDETIALFKQRFGEFFRETEHA